MQVDGARVNAGTGNTGVEMGAAGGRHGGLANGYGVDAVPPIEHAGTCPLLPHPPESALPSRAMAGREGEEGADSRGRATWATAMEEQSGDIF
jgi:hypothetical protein